MFLVGSLLLVSLSILAQSDEQEIALYSSAGKPIAYIAVEDDFTIYLWDGKPVAYLQGENIYGFNGKHLGWYKSGAAYDHEGTVAGATKGKLRGIPQISPIKSIKQIKPIKAIRQIAPIRPIFQLTWSKDSFKNFLLQGID